MERSVGPRRFSTTHWTLVVAAGATDAPGSREAIATLCETYSFLLASVGNFLANQHDWEVAAKRGGGQSHLPLEFDTGEVRYSNEPVDAMTPEDLYERNWAHAVIATALARLESDQTGGSRREMFSALKPLLTGDGAVSYAAIAARFA